jgi:DNA-binding NtrC family response regulator
MGRKRSSIAVVSRLLATSSTPVYAVDHDRRLVYCNSACLEWLGVDAGSLLERRCDYHSDGCPGEPDQVVAALCPPPEAFVGQAVVTEVDYRTAGGGVARRRARFVPLNATATAVTGVLAFIDREDLPDGDSAADREQGAASLHGRLRQLRQAIGQRYRASQIVGASPAMVRVREQVKVASQGDWRVLVAGPPGSGREFIARTIHYGGAEHQTAPLAPLACHLLDSELLETTISSFIASCAELETEHPPALLLLEVDQLPIDAQAALAGVLSIGELGVRTIATSRKPLLELAAEDRFRCDLAHTLSTLVIEIPPLSERPDDIPLLAQLALESVNAQGGKQLSGFTEEALDQLARYPWPSNGDELAEFVQQAVRVAAGPFVQAVDLPDRVRLAAGAAAHSQPADELIRLDGFLADVERELLQRALLRAKGNKAQAARLLSIPRSRLLRKLEHYNIS